MAQDPDGAGGANDPDEVESSRMTLGEHLQELRVRLIRSVVTILVCFAVAWFFRVELTGLAIRPFELSATRLQHYKVAFVLDKLEGESDRDPLEWFTRESWSEYGESGDPRALTLVPAKAIPATIRTDTAGGVFFMQMKVCFYFALFVGGPVLLWQLWQFIAAGLYRQERSVVHAYFPFSVSLFVGGVLFGYFVMVPNAMYFLAKMHVAQEQFTYWQGDRMYWHFLTTMTLALGAVFQLPVVMLALARLDIVQPKTFAKYRAHTVIASLVLAALLTPPDPITQMMMAIPIALLYELGHVVARIAHRKQAPRSPGPGPRASS